MKINETDLDIPNPKDIPSHLKGECLVGQRTKIRFVWLDSYVKDGDCLCCWAYKLSLSNYGSVTLDDEPVKDKDQIEFVKKFFGEIAW